MVAPKLTREMKVRRALHALLDIAVAVATIRDAARELNAVQKEVRSPGEIRWIRNQRG